MIAAEVMNKLSCWIIHLKQATAVSVNKSTIQYNMIMKWLHQVEHRWSFQIHWLWRHIPGQTSLLFCFIFNNAAPPRSFQMRLFKATLLHPFKMPKCYHTGRKILSNFPVFRTHPSYGILPLCGSWRANTAAQGSEGSNYAWVFSLLTKIHAIIA